MTSRRPLIAGNWKMHHGPGATQRFLERLLTIELPPEADAVVCPPFVSLPVAAMMLSASRVGLGAQNVHWADHGAFTGEVAAAMLSELGVGWAIVGHSERRSLFGETDETALERALAAQHAGLQVIFCIGETLEQRSAGQTFAVLERQTAALGRLDPGSLVLAYEPVWAIGTGQTATPDQAQEAHAFLRDRFAGLAGSDAAGQLRILYGGSLKPANTREIVGLPDVDGGLVGGASLDVDSYFDMIRAAADCVAGV
jgi:triosephosphate isomerase